jgi:hypothetical protein
MKNKIDKSKCLHYKFESFRNIDGGIIPARDLLDSLKKFNAPFLKKHSQYMEDYNLTIGELSTTLEYYIYDKIYGSEEDRGSI